jgi:type IV pilus assembly protein PilV
MRGKNKGFSLLELLIALLVFSIGLLGLAGLLVVSVKTNQSAYLRSQASFLSQSMADRMRNNIMGVWTNAYNSAIPGGATTTCPCTPAQLATRDLFMWSQELASFLPNATGNINCVRSSAVAVPNNDRRRPPYDGVCTLTLNWSEATLDREAAGGAPQLQTFTWVFQP